MALGPPKGAVASFGHPWPEENLVLLENGTFWAGWGGWPAISWKSSMKSLTGRFMPKKRAFSTESEHFPRFFGTFWPSMVQLGWV